MLFVSSATRFFVVESVLWFRTVCETIDDVYDDVVVVRNAVDTAVRDNRLNAVDMIRRRGFTRTHGSTRVK